MLAWVMKSKAAIHLIEKWSYDYIKMDCEDGRCYGVLAVRDILCVYTSRLNLLSGPSHMLRALPPPLHPQPVPHRCARYRRQASCSAERVRGLLVRVHAPLTISQVVGAESARLARLGRGFFLHSEWLLHGLGQLHIHDRRHRLYPPRSRPSRRLRALLVRDLP